MDLLLRKNSAEADTGNAKSIDRLEPTVSFCLRKKLMGTGYHEGVPSSFLHSASHFQMLIRSNIRETLPPASHARGQSMGLERRVNN